MKKLILILSIIILTSCATMKGGGVEYILAMNSFGDRFYVPVTTLKYEMSDGTYDKIYFYYDESWHLGKDWYNSLHFPFRTKKEQEKFEKKYNKKLKGPETLMLNND